MALRMNKISPYAWPGMHLLHSSEKTVANNYDTAQIIEAVCHYYRISLPMLCKRGRERKYVKGMHVAWYIIRKQVRDTSLKQLGRLFGSYDHTSVLYGLQKIESELPLYHELEFEVKMITQLARQIA